MRMVKLIAGLIFISLFLISCGPSGPTSFDINYFEGDEGLITEFAKNSPPSEIPENEEFTIHVILKNRGASNVSELYHKINYDSLYFTMENTETNFFSQLGGLLNLQESIPGKSIAFPLGSEVYTNYNMKSKELHGQLQNPSTTISAVSCYKYKTILGEEICIQRNELDADLKAQPCEATDEKFSKGQGGPVAITKLETDFFSEGDLIKPYFKIYFKNIGSGTVVENTKVLNVCSGQNIDIDDWHVLKVRAYLSGEELNCINNGIVRVNAPEPSIRCIANNPENFARGGAAYSRFLRVVAEYGYFDQESKEVTVVRRN